MSFFCLGLFFGGILLQKLKPQTLMRIAGILLLVGFGTITLALDFEAPGKSLVIMYIFYGVICGTGVGVGYNVLISTILKWFPDSVGLASGVLLMGFGLGGLILGSVVNVVVGVIGIKNIFLPLGIVMAALIFIFSPLIKNPAATSQPDRKTGGDDGKPVAETSAADERKEYNALAMLKTACFWLLFAWGICVGTGGLLVINSAATISVYYGGAAVAGLIVSVFIGGTRPPIGFVFDRFGRKAAFLTATLFMLLGGILLTMGAVTKNPVFIFIGIPCVGISYGSTSTMASGTISRFFGMKYYSVNFAVNTFSLIPAAMIGPIVSSKLQEAAGGDFQTTFIMLIAIGAVALITTFLISAFAKKEKLEN
jgi:OFA family oxalate/formate antiporter-like MFS transporter